MIERSTHRTTASEAAQCIIPSFGSVVAFFWFAVLPSNTRNTTGSVFGLVFVFADALETYLRKDSSSLFYALANRYGSKPCSCSLRMEIFVTKIFKHGT